MTKKLMITLLLIIFLSQLIMFSPPSSDAQNIADDVYLAYVHEGTVTLADSQGMPLAQVGPDFASFQPANIFWSDDGRLLYIARSDGLYQTGPGGSSSVRIPGNYGITLAYDRSGDVIYYLESSNPQEGENPDTLTFPFREINTTQSQGATGRLVGYIGEYPTSTRQINLYGASMQYARDGGVLSLNSYIPVGRPKIITTYGSTVFYSCCYPAPGLNAIDILTGEKRVYDPEFIPGSAGLNGTRTHIAGETTSANIRIIDLISGGTRDYAISLGTVERIAWSLDDSALFLVSRENPQNPVEPNPRIETPIDNQSALIVVWRLDLASGRVQRLAELGDFYGVPSIAVTYDYVFLVAVESNRRLVDDLNAGRLPLDIAINDPRLVTDYLPNSVLFRIRTDGSEALSIMADVWGVASRPRR